MAYENRDLAPTHGTHASVSVPADIQALVEAEVARQLAKARAEIDDELTVIKSKTLEDRAALVVFSGDLDKLLASLVIATGAAASGLDTSLFFTFWGLSALKKKDARAANKSLKQKLLSIMTGSGTESLGTSKLNFFGAGAWMFREMMKEKEISSLEELFSLAQEMGVKMTACMMSMDVMGIEKEELIDGLEYGGVAAFLADASGARLSLFI